MYSIEFSETAKKQFNKLEKKKQKRIVMVFERIKIRPFHFVKSKQNSKYFILRIGQYRAILDINKNKRIIYVVEFGHRRKIYK